MSARVLADAIPELMTEMEELAHRTGEESILEQLSSLRLVDRCRCGDDFCATIFTETPPTGPWGVGHESRLVSSGTSVIGFDLVGGKIVCIEVLHRPDIRKRLLELLP